MSSVSYYFVSRKVDVLLNQTMYFTPPLLQLKPHMQLHGYTLSSTHQLYIDNNDFDLFNV